MLCRHIKHIEQKSAQVFVAVLFASHVCGGTSENFVSLDIPLCISGVVFPRLLRVMLLGDLGWGGKLLVNLRHAGQSMPAGTNKIVRARRTAVLAVTNSGLAFQVCLQMLQESTIV